MRAVVMVAVVIRINLISFMFGGITFGVGSGAGVTIRFGVSSLAYHHQNQPPPPSPPPLPPPSPHIVHLTITLIKLLQLPS